MITVIQGWASLNLLGVLLWAMWVEIRILRRRGGRR